VRNCRAAAPRIEIAALSRSVEPGEEERLADKIATLGSESEPLRSLLEKQIRDAVQVIASASYRTIGRRTHLT
jgi:hypothetical protein